MARKKGEDKEESAYWMDTYGDMVTLLLTFFILLFAMSSLDSEKFDIFVRAMKTMTNAAEQFVVVQDSTEMQPGDGTTPPSGTGPTLGTVETPDEVKEFADLYMFLTEYVKQQGLEGEISLAQGEGYTYIDFSSSIFFDGDSAVLLPQGQDILRMLCAAMTHISKDISEIQAHGHTAQERGDRENQNVEFDRNLSGNRASNVVAFIQRNSNIAPPKLNAKGYGQYVPKIPHDATEETRKINRRVELIISETGAVVPTLEEIYAKVKAGAEPDAAASDVISSRAESEAAQKKAESDAAVKAASDAAAAASDAATGASGAATGASGSSAASGTSSEISSGTSSTTTSSVTTSG